MNFEKLVLLQPQWSGYGRIVIAMKAALAELARRTQRCEDLSEVADYFHDQVVTRSLMNASKPVEAERLVTAVDAAVKHAGGRDGCLENIYVWRVQKTDFLHGAARWGEHLIAFFMFEGLEQGLVVVAPMVRPGPTKFLRLTVLKRPASALLVPKPAGLQ